MSPRQALFDRLERGCTQTFPGCVALVWREGALRYHEAHGVLATHPSAGGATRAPAKRHSVYDLASLTKVLSTTTLLAMEHSAGRLDLSAPLPAPLDVACPGATFEDLLRHRAGLVAHREFFLGRRPGEVDALMADLLGTPRRGPPKQETVYSDLGFILLGRWLEQSCGAPLDELFEQRIARPLYLDAAAATPSPGLHARLAALGYRRASREGWLPASLESELAPTEVYEPDLHADELPSHFEFRAATTEHLAHGRVHDDNALQLDGVAGHAGLFGHAEGVLALARAWLDADLGISAPTRELFWREATSAEGRPLVRRLGWDGQSPDASGSTGGALDAAAVGHLGFTGTSLWIDPRAQAVYILLSNRVHPTRRAPADAAHSIRELRRDFHRLACEL